MNWRLAGSLVTLRGQINAMYPNRNKASDGTLGDAAHQKVASDHNPNPQGIVTALDLTHDPNSLDIADLAQKLIQSRDSRIKYIIANRKIMIPPNWNWQNYAGANPHTKHIHISVNAKNCDDTTKWNLEGDMDWKAKFFEAQRIGNEWLAALQIKDKEIADLRARNKELYDLAEDRLKAIRIYEQKGDINAKLDKIINKLGA